MKADENRRAITLPALTLAALQLATRVVQSNLHMPPSYAQPCIHTCVSDTVVSPEYIVKFAVECVDAFAPTHAMLAPRLRLQVAVATGAMAAAVDGIEVGLGNAVCHTVAGSFQLFEDIVADANK